MPFKSKAQERWMYWKGSKSKKFAAMAKRWSAHTKKGAKLPEHVKK
jgi:hypothetical protein